MPLVLSGTDGVSGVDGTASNPAIEGTDSNTGIFYPAADTVAIGTGGTEALRVNSSQNVGIGTTSPTGGANRVVDVYGSGSSAINFHNATSGTTATDGGVVGQYGSDLVLFNYEAGIIQFGTSNTERMRITSSGNVGIGTSSPSSFSTYRYLDLVGGGTSTGGVFQSKTSDGAVANSLYTTGSAGAIGTGTNHPLQFLTNDTERARIDSSGNMMWNGTNTTTGNGNVGFVYKFFGGANNIIIPMESSSVDRYGVLEYRRTGRAQARTSQIGIGENSLSQGDVQVFSSAANSDISGGVRLSNGATAWAAISDIRLKTVTGTYTNALQDIAQIEPIKFTWKHDQSNTPQVGVSAQSVEPVVPEAMSISTNIATPDDKTEYLSVRYTELIPLMIASIQELNAKVEAQAAEIAALKAQP